MEIQKKCFCCGNQFTAKRVTTKYCSNACNSKHYKLRKKVMDDPSLSFNEKLFKEELFKQQATINVKPYLSIKEAGKFIGMSRSSIYRLIKSGQLKVTKIDRKSVV